MSYFNKFKSTEIRGSFLNSANGQEEESHVTIHGSLELGLESQITITNPETGIDTPVYTNSGGEIVFKINGQTFTLDRQKLQYLVNIQSDVQNQIDAKPTINYVNSQISLLDTELDTKANTSDLINYVSLANQQTITGDKRFQQLPRYTGSNQPTVTGHFTPKSYVDSSISSATSTLQTSIAAKLDTSVYNTDQTSILGLINAKVDLSLFNSTVTSLNSSIATKANDADVVKKSGNQVISDLKTFEILPQCTAIPTNPSDLVTKSWIDSNFTPNGTSVNFATTTQLNDGLALKTDLSTFTSTVTSLTNSISTKAAITYVDSGLSTKLNISSYNTDQTALIAQVNGKVDVSTFTSTVTTLNNSINTKAAITYVDSGLSTKLNISTYNTDQTALSAQVNGKVDVSTFNSTVNSLNNSIAAKASTAYVDSADSALLTDINTRALDSIVVKLTTDQSISGIKSFNTNLPQSTLTPTLDNEFTRKGYVDNLISGCAKLASTNSYSGLNTFWNTTTFNGSVNVNNSNAGITMASGDLQFTSSTAAQGIKGSTTQHLFLSSMATRNIYINEGKGASTISSVIINQNHDAGTTEMYGGSVKVHAPMTVNSSLTLNANLSSNSNIITSGGLSSNALTTGNAYCGNVITNTIAKNNYSFVDCLSPLNGNLFYTYKSGLSGWIVNINGSTGASSLIPIFCSMRNTIQYNVDSMYILAAYTEIIVYSQPQYQGTSQTLTNDSANWERIVPTTKDTIDSIKVFRKEKLDSTSFTEIIINGISNSTA